MKTSARRKHAIAIANARWVLSQRVWASRKASRFAAALSDNLAVQNRSDGEGPFLLRSATSPRDSDRPRIQFNWNFLWGVALAAGVSATFWAGVAIVISRVSR
jgi:hypothetical protein